jgi:hypothetical protein
MEKHISKSELPAVHNYYAQFWLDLQIDKPYAFHSGGDGSCPMWYWNLILSRRNLSLWTKGIIPHRGFRLRDTKNYFGIKGDAKKTLATLETMIEHVQKYGWL